MSHEKKSNILVCGNGPSCKEIDWRRVPADSKIMRVTNFFFESDYYVGKKVDYYIDYYKRIDNQYFNIRTVNEKGEYEVDMENIWMTVMFEKDPHFPVVKMATALIQQTPMIAEFRSFYEYYYGQYLPTGMQALALAVCLGYKNVFVTGYDLFAEDKQLHLYDEPRNPVNFDNAVKSFKKKSEGLYDTTASADHGNDRVQSLHPPQLQIDFVKLLRKLFPDTHICSVSPDSPINSVLSMAPVVYDEAWYIPVRKPDDRTTDWYELPDTMPKRKLVKED